MNTDERNLLDELNAAGDGLEAGPRPAQGDGRSLLSDLHHGLLGGGAGEAAWCVHVRHNLDRWEGGMALSEEEAKRTYTYLSDAAQEFGLDWVLDQVDEKIALGKTAVRKVPTKVDEQLDTGDLWGRSVEDHREERGALARYVVAEEYSSTERLEVLIDALLLAVPAAHHVARETLAGLGEFGTVEALAFVADMPGREPKMMRTKDLESRRRAVTRVEVLLNELKAQLQNVH